MAAICQLKFKKNRRALFQSVKRCDVGFDVYEGHQTSMKFYRQLEEGEIKTLIENPYNNGNPIYLLFHSTHLFKNFYNNFQH